MSLKTPYTKTSTGPQAPSGINLSIAQDEPSRLPFWCALALGIHLLVVVIAVLVITILQFLHIWDIPLFQTSVKPRDIEFVLVDNTPKERPRHPTRLRAEHASRSGGQKIANRPTAVPQQAAGAPSKQSQPRAASRPQPVRKPAPQVARQQPQPQQRQAVSHQQPAPRPMPQPPKPQVSHAPTPQPPKPTPAPAPKMPRPTKVASASPTPAPNPIAPTIRTPAPKNPSAVSAGPVARTAGGSPSTGGGAPSGGGSPSSSMIAGGPTRAGSSGGGNPGASGRPGGRSGGGGQGSYNQVGSPGGGGGRPGIDAEAEPDFGPYIAELQRRIKRNWAPPTEDRNKRVVVVFRISRDGRLTSIQMKVSSGSPAADQAAISAVRLSAPFRQLPPGYKGNEIPVEFTFDYQVFGGRTR